MGVKHAQAALVDAESCAHCRVMPARILESRLRVAASSKNYPVLSFSKGGPMLARLLRDEPDEEDNAILSAAQASRPMSTQSGDVA